MTCFQASLWVITLHEQRKIKLYEKANILQRLVSHQYQMIIWCYVELDNSPSECEVERICIVKMLGSKSGLSIFQATGRMRVA